MPYFHIVFTLPAAIADITYQNKAVVYEILFKDHRLVLVSDVGPIASRVSSKGL